MSEWEFPPCSFCLDEAITAMSGAVRLRFCQEHNDEYHRIGMSLDGRGPLASEVMLDRYPNAERWTR